MQSRKMETYEFSKYGNGAHVLDQGVPRGNYMIRKIIFCIFKGTSMGLAPKILPIFMSAGSWY